MGSLLFLTSCLSYFIEQPTFTLRDVAINAISLTETQLILGLDVQNPNRYDLELNRLEFEIYIQDKKLGRGWLQNRVTIRKAGTSYMRIPVTVSHENIERLLTLVIAGRDVPYKLAGKARVKAGYVGAMEIPFSTEALLNLNRSFGNRN